MTCFCRDGLKENIKTEQVVLDANTDYTVKYLQKKFFAVVIK
jgi:hypothetical protein